MTAQVIRPIITEKSMSLVSKGWYTFGVTSHSRKEEIAKLIESLYGVNVIDVRTVSQHGKWKKRGKLSKAVKQEDWKKAMVRLVKGQTIELFSLTHGEEAPVKA